MRIANVSGRLTLVSEEGGIDVEKASAGRFGPDPQAVFRQWKAFRRWADDAPSRGAAPIDSGELGAAGAETDSGVRDWHELPRPRRRGRPGRAS